MDQTRFAARRAAFMEQLGDTIAIVPAGNAQIRNDDVEHDFRQDSNFFFLTGFAEPDSIAVFDPAHDAEHYTLFVRARNPEIEAWEGLRAGTDGAMDRFGADAAFELDELEAWLRKRLIGRRDVAYTFGGPNDDRVLKAINSARHHARHAGLTTPERFSNPGEILHEMRLFKSAEEIEALRRACEISAAAHSEAMRFTQPGMTERQVQGAIEYVFTTMGAERVGYGSIVAGGTNATILHYIENDRPLNDGDLLLIDAGAEYQHLTADITRTFPINGKFSPVQRAVYDVVLDAQRQVIDLCAPDLPWLDMHDKAAEILSHGLVDLGLLPGSGEEALQKGWFREFYFHGTGHWLGIDVHDAGTYGSDDAWHGRRLEPSMALTVEPGLYVAPTKTSVTLSHAGYDAEEIMHLTHDLGAGAAKEELAKRKDEAGTFDFEVPGEFLGLGIRIEDDILITTDGQENMSAGTPADPDEIEALCAEESGLPLFA